ncbi:hypothetical protein [Paludibacterium yongneupense]|uniref:hypothetical protein n=1 Tax=Paludibacterium yongneupense TaxID=400061 RepID=UPI00041BD283|nr:hypothetical protein [Paludibacterium yongneupense]
MLAGGLDLLDATLAPCLAGALCAGLIVFYCRAFPGGETKAWSRALAHGGTMSFSIYLLHGFVKDALQGAGVSAQFELLAVGALGPVLGANPWLAGAALYLPATLALAALSYHTIEKPFLALRGRY